MKRIRLPVSGVVAAIGASAASAKTVLELKDEGVPVAVGAEIGVEMETPEFFRCKWAQRAHVSVNRAKQVKLAVEPATEKQECPGNESADAFSEIPRGVGTIAMTIAGGAPLRGSPLRLTSGVVIGPGPTCTYDFKKFSGTFSIPGHAVIEGSAVGKLNRRLSEERYPPEVAGSCEQSDTERFRVGLRGHNNQFWKPSWLAERSTWREPAGNSLSPWGCVR